VRKLIAMVMLVILLASLTLPASAAAAREFLLREYDVTDTEVLCYGKRVPAGGKLEVTANSQLVEDAVITTLEQDRIPVTVYCLVDSSTSLSEKMVQRRTDALLNISSLMGSEDNMVLATIDGALTESKPMDKKDARDTAIRTISGQVWYTNLYDGMSQALDSLHTSTVYHTNRCLVVISDGHDDEKSVATGDDILKKIRETGIPVYTLILTDAVLDEKEASLQKQFAEESLGGFLSFPDKDGVSASTAAQRIWDSIKSACAIRIGVEALQASGTDQQLMIRYDTADTRYEDTILIRAVDLPVPVPETTAPVPEETDPTEETTSEEDEEEGMSKEMLLACGIGGVLLLIGIAAFFLLRKKPEEAAVIPETIPNPEEPVYITDTEPVDDFFTPTDPPVSDNPAIDVTMPVTNRCHVQAVALMHPEVACDFYLTPKMEITFGRTQKADIILNSSDKKLSGCHGCFFWDEKLLLVQDRQSTNGTSVNGQACNSSSWMLLEQGAILKAGSYEYRIHFKVDEP